MRCQWGLVAVGLAMFASSAFLVGCSSSGNSALDSSSASALADVPVEDNRIRARDTIEVAVTSAPELSRTVVVDPSGRVNLPLIGQVPVGGKTSDEAAAEVAGRLNRRYLRSPTVLVTLKQSGQIVTVTGAIGATGMGTPGKDAVVPIVNGMTLSQVIIAAGGLSEVANSDSVHLARKTSNGLKDEVYNYDAIVKGQAEDPRVFGGDMVLIEKAGYKVAGKTIREIGGYMFLVPLATGM